MKIYIARDEEVIALSNREMRKDEDGDFYSTDNSYFLLVNKDCFKDFKRVVKISPKEGQQIVLNIPYKTLKKYIKEVK